jgi:exoribonuclease R
MFSTENITRRFPCLGQNPSKNQLRWARKKMNAWLRNAVYSPRCDQHFGLNIPAYTHFTSPLRRYADLVNHRIVASFLEEKPPPYTYEELLKISEHISSEELLFKKFSSGEGQAQTFVN